MPSLNQIVCYYRDCYKADNSSIALWDIFKLKKADYYVLEGKDELGTGFLPRLPIENVLGKALLERSQQYLREKQLLYIRYILAGQLELDGDVKTIAAPIIYNEAEIECEQGQFYFTIDDKTFGINEPVLAVTNPEFSLGNLSEQELKSTSFWANLFSESPSNISSFQVLDFPNLVDLATLKKCNKAKKLTLLPASMLVLLDKAKASRGVIHELDQIIDSSVQSNALAGLLTGQAESESVTDLKHQYLPCLLSAAQNKIISTAATAPLSCVSGPPGTGKSYTISAIAAENMARGKKVLIVSHTEQALEVISQKLADNFEMGDIAIRAGQKTFLRQFKRYLADLLEGYSSFEDGTNLQKLEIKLNSLGKKVDKLERKFEKFCQQAIRRGHRIQALEKKESKWRKHIYFSLFKTKIFTLEKQWLALEQLNTLLKQKENAASSYLSLYKQNQLNTLLKEYRQVLKTFKSAVSSRTSQRQFERFSEVNYDALLAAFPVWLVSLNTLHKVLPMKHELFDLVILDEATQCNISACLPAFFRAKRAVVIGDNKQLKHYSFLSKQKETSILKEQELTWETNGVLSYRDNSVLDLALEQIKNGDQVNFLDEHFRSQPELIYFSNKQFYQNKLKVIQHRPCTSSGHLIIESTGGSRDTYGVNKTEAGKIISDLRCLVDNQSSLSIKQTIGVISPFRAQAEYLKSAINKQFSVQEIEAHKILVATPYGFQGEERDLVFISFALDNKSVRAASYLNKADVFNVCVTRARSMQHVYLSIDANKLPTSNLLAQYVASASEFNAVHSTADSMDAFQQQVSERLKDLGIQTWPGYHIAGTEIDLLCGFDGKYLAVDLIGFPGPWSDFFKLETYKLFKRVGVEIMPVTYGLWTLDAQTCIQKIAEKLGCKC
ncbi:DEAD/DEAH box helicase [Catenovulum agarivorans]|uniref:DEAD/DEAH box helicase n=1 Tax=Catenovulum agarivorans TaxID=1172192 RepID=UPI00030FADAB|nr:ATP-binding protein [Catenovulum agarivorans]